MQLVADVPSDQGALLVQHPVAQDADVGRGEHLPADIQR